MNKTDLINAVAEQADLTKKEAGSAVDAVFESIQNSPVSYTHLRAHET